jgi:radical SAM-linked protein
MAPELSLATREPAPKTPAAPPRYKYRVRFGKSGDLRFVSHHDLMHVCERLFRRADLNLPVTQGFNPRPRMWFASAMALGVAGLNEVLEFELTQPLDAGEIQSRLAGQAPPGLSILSVRAIDVKMSARVRRALYRLPLSNPNASLLERCTAFLAQTECWVERRRPHPRRVNIRPFVAELHTHRDCLNMALWITPNGAARPEEVIAALGLQSLLDGGAVIERTDLEIYDELPPDTEGPPLIEAAFEEISANDREPSEPSQERPMAIFDSPMSFDS